jgi:hypothetical protein
MLNRIADGRPMEESARLLSKFQIKRNGKDRDNMFWNLGKIHGLEYLAYATEAELKEAAGNPVLIQRLANKIMDEDRFQAPTSFDGHVSELEQFLAEYRNQVESGAFGKRELFTSDKKKLLALPYFLSKRREHPAPKKGQWQWDLFTEVNGGDAWDKYDGVKFDPEEKITEFNYEKFIPQAQLRNMDTSSDEFKMMIKEMNLKQKTAMEQHFENQAKF